MHLSCGAARAKAATITTHNCVKSQSIGLYDRAAYDRTSDLEERACAVRGLTHEYNWKQSYFTFVVVSVL